MCGILHRRMFRPWLWLESAFSLSSYGRSQNKQLDLIHGLTKEVMQTCCFPPALRAGNFPLMQPAGRG